jgi:bacterial/archaeal transporter family-2 protein
MADPAMGRMSPLHILAALASGGLLTLMIHFNAELAHFGGPLFSSWCAHGTGTIAAVVYLLMLNRGRWPRPESSTTAGRAPFWAYLGGLSGAVTVMLSGITVNSPVALTGTLALGLAGQVLFSLASDHWGLFGMAARRITLRDILSVVLISAGSLLIIVFGARAV